jgi:NTE family protein
VLVLQGGGALGAYQAGVYERLAEAGLAPGWLAGISIGAINAALIAGNAPALRVPRLREFWDRVGVPGSWNWLPVGPAWSAGYAVAFGVPHFFAPRLTPAALAAPGSEAAISLYDTAPLRETLLELIDFERINHDGVRLSVGAVDVCSGESRWFDSAQETITVDHLLASAALPPGFPPVTIDGVPYWDGGVVSNTPLQFVLDQPRTRELLVFAVDLFSARGPMPRNLAEVAEREKDIRYSSRTRLETDLLRRLQQLRRHAARLIEQLPAAQRDSAPARALLAEAEDHGVTLVQLAHRRRLDDRASKDFEFARDTLAAHWRMGHEDLQQVLASAAWRHRAAPRGGVKLIDAVQAVPEQEPAGEGRSAA